MTSVAVDHIVVDWLKRQPIGRERRARLEAVARAWLVRGLLGAT